MGVRAMIRALVRPPATFHHFAVIDEAIRRADAELTIADLRLRRLEARRRLRAERVEPASSEET